MTEAEWLVCADPQEMLDFLRGKASDRKFRLLVVAYCRSIWHLITDDLSKNAVTVAERFADGVETAAELRTARDRVGENGAPVIEGVLLATRTDARKGAEEALKQAVHYLYGAEATIRAERVSQSGFLRDIFGNPFRPATVDPSWLTWNGGTVPKLAQTIYDERRFQDMPILADALEEAGCTNADILAHCRWPGAHVRGCWVVDLLLSKDR
jgi:hypothetical protein